MTLDEKRRELAEAERLLKDLWSELEDARSQYEKHLLVTRRLRDELFTLVEDADGD